MFRIVTTLIALITTITPLAAEEWGYIYHRVKEPERENLLGYDRLCVTGVLMDAETGVRVEDFSLLKNCLRGVCAGKEFYPLVTFSSYRDGMRVLSPGRAQEKVLDGLARLVYSHGLEGLHFDVEHLPSIKKAELARFLARVRERLPGKIITMALFPALDYNDPRRHLHDYSLLSDVLHGAVIMTYDYHRNGTEPGPVTDLAWVEKNIRYALEYYPAQGLWLGIPAYGYLWRKGKRATAVSLSRARWLAERYGSRRHASGCLLIKGTDSRGHFTLYAPDEKTRSDMKKLAEKYSLAGTATWRVGLE
jgi:spore germination protein YaaH